MKNDIILVELNHKSAPIEIRETISVNADRIHEILHDLKKDSPEIFVLTTCNRISAYSFSRKVEPILEVFQSFCDKIDKSHLTILYNELAVKHLFSTSSGLESQTIGEHEILGQIRNAFIASDQSKNNGPILNELVNKAIHVGKRVRTETLIGKYAVSFAAITHNIIKEKFGGVDDISVMVYGSGEMAQIVLKMLVKMKVGKIYIVSNDLDRANRLAQSYQAIPVSYIGSKKLLVTTEVLIGATRTKSYILNKKKLESSNGPTPGLMVDLGMPRNFNPDINSSKGIKLHDLDDLKHSASEAIEKRKDEIVLAESIIVEEVSKFMKWFGFRDYVPLIKKLKDQLADAENETLKGVFEESKSLTKNQKEAIEGAMNRAIKKILSRTITFYREANNSQF